MRTPTLMVLFVVACCAAVSPAHAHLMPRQHATVNVRDSAAFGAFSIPVAALTGWDTNRDGRMSATEFALHRVDIVRQLDAGILITNGHEPGRRDLLLPNVEFDETDTLAANGGTHLLVLVRQSFAVVPTALRLELRLFGPALDERSYLVKATAQGRPEVAMLTRDIPSHLFFSPRHWLLDWYEAPLFRRIAAVGGAAMLVLLGVVAARWQRTSARPPAAPHPVLACAAAGSKARPTRTPPARTSTRR